MRYTWDSRAAFDMGTLPKAAASSLKMATIYQVKTLIWLCCVGNGQFDAAACAAACGCSPEFCAEAVEYWVQQGVLVTEEEDLSPAPTVMKTPAPDTSFKEAASLAKEPTALLPTIPVATMRPDRTQVLQTRACDERFAFLLDTAAEKLGKVLSPADMQVYLYLYRDLQLPPEVILLIIGYAVKNGKAKLSYIEKTAVHWAENGIVTMDAADKHLCHLEHCQSAWEAIEALHLLETVRPTVAQKEAACRWIYEYKLSLEVIEVALRYTVEKGTRSPIPYADKLLERLHSEGVTTADKAKQALTAEKPSVKKKHHGRMKTATDRPPSFDLGNYEEMALRHRPRRPDQEG